MENGRVIATIYESFITAYFEHEPYLLTPELMADIEDHIIDNMLFFLHDQIQKALENSNVLND